MYRTIAFSTNCKRRCDTHQYLGSKRAPRDATRRHRITLTAIGFDSYTYVPASQLPAPKFNLELGPFYLSGNEVYTESNECNLVNNGKGDWKIKFDNSGEDLKGSLANPPCPF